MILGFLFKIIWMAISNPLTPIWSTSLGVCSIQIEI